MSSQPHLPTDHLPRRWWRHPELVVAMLVLLLFLVLSSLQIVSRFILPMPLTWTEELTAALVIWMTFIGGIAVERANSQLRVSLIAEIFPAKVVAVIYTLFDIAIIGCLIAIIIGGWDTLSETSYQKTPALGISFNFIISIVPLASIVLIPVILFNSVKRLRQSWRAR